MCHMRLSNAHNSSPVPKYLGFWPTDRGGESRWNSCVYIHVYILIFDSCGSRVIHCMKINAKIFSFSFSLLFKTKIFEKFSNIWSQSGTGGALSNDPFCVNPSFFLPLARCMKPVWCSSYTFFPCLCPPCRWALKGHHFVLNLFLEGVLLWI